MNYPDGMNKTFFDMIDGEYQYCKNKNKLIKKIMQCEKVSEAIAKNYLAFVIEHRTVTYSEMEDGE